MFDAERCPDGRHRAKTSRDALVLQWSIAVPRNERIRVQESTCPCQDSMYELCYSSGQAFIRWTIRGDTGIEVPFAVLESERWRPALAQATWMALLAGHAR